MHIEKKIQSNKIYSGKVVTLELDEVELENGKKAYREVVRHTGGAAVLAIDEEQNLYFVKQFRYPYEEEMLEIPAGKLNKGEDPFECAQRELQEETGLIANKWEKVGVFRPTPGYTDELLHVYIAKDLAQGCQKLDEDEFLDVVKLDVFSAVKKIESGEITDAKTVIAILKYAYEMH